MSLLTRCIILFLLIQLAVCSKSSPALLLSYKMVPGLKSSLPHSEQLPFTPEEANYIVKSTFEQCLSDLYIIVHAPGLKVEDFQHFEGFDFLRDSVAKSSTVISMPNIVFNENEEKALNLDLFTKTLKIQCNVQIYEVNNDGEDEFPKYIDTRKRLIKVNLTGLSDELTEEERVQKLKDFDYLLKRIARKAPTPNFSVLYTTKTTRDADLDELNDPSNVIEMHDLPNDPKAISLELRNKMRAAKNMIFPDMTIFDKSRYFEFERNPSKERNLLEDDALPNGMWAKDAQPNAKTMVDDTWNEPKTKIIRKEESLYRFGEDTKEVLTLANQRQFILDNAAFIAFGFLAIGSIIFFDFLKLLFLGIKNLFTVSKKNAGKNITRVEDKPVKEQKED